MRFIQKNITLLYIFAFALQLILFSYYLVNSLSITLPNYNLFDGVAIYFNGHKKIELLQYLISVVILGIYFLVLLILDKNLNYTTRRYVSYQFSSIVHNKKILLIAIFILIIVPTILFFVGKSFTGKLLFQTLNLFLLVLLPFFAFWKHFYNKTLYKQVSWFENITLPVKRDNFFILLILIGYLQLVYIFYDPIVNKPKIINEYLNIPEKTIIDKNLIVDNTEYIQTKFPSSITFKGDISKSLNDANCITATPKSLNMFRPSFEDNIIFYNDDKNITCVNGLLDLNNSNNDTLYALLENQENRQRALDVLDLDVNDTKFLDSNKFEVHWQILSRFMIHHNSFVFIPVGELHDGKDINSINAQYGLGNVILFDYILSNIDQISFDNILRINYIAYFLYFAFFIGVVYLITKNILWTSLIFILSLTFINLRGYDFLLLPPGESPWRHFFDIFVLYCLYKFGQSNKKIYWFMALIFGILSIFMNPQIGIMIFIAIIIATIFYTLYSNSDKKFFLLSSFILVVIGGSIFKLLSSSDELSKYYIDGVIGFPISFSEMLKILIVIVITYLMLWKIIRNHLSYNNYLFLVFLVIYSQELVLYVVWHFDINGFKARAFIYILTLGLLLFYLRHYFLEKLNRNVLIAMGVLIGIFYLNSAKTVFKSKKEYEKIFVTHQTYQWNFDRANFISTMNPKYFADAVSTIEHYSYNNRGIYIISEYDNILPFLAKKYSLMPFFDLKWYILTNNELIKCINSIKENKPQYLYVDTNIDRNLNNEIIDSKWPEVGYLNEESRWRVERLKLLNKIFQSVKSDYELVEEGSLISVYKRKYVK